MLPASRISLSAAMTVVIVRGHRHAQPSAHGYRLQRPAIEYQKPVLFGMDEVLLSPPAHDADGGLDGCSDHVCDFLSGERQRNERPLRSRLTHVGGQLQEETSE